MPSPSSSQSSLPPSSSSSSSRVLPSSRAHAGLPSTIPSAGSATQTITGTPADGAATPVRLHLRGQHEESGEEEATQTSGRGGRGHIRWAEGTVDNEGMGKKSSKVCCIYHPPTAPGESSDESSSDSSSDSDSSDLDDGSARPVGGSRRSSRKHRHQHHDHDHDHADDPLSKGKAARKPSPNAYERQPRKAEVKR